MSLCQGTGCPRGLAGLDDEPCGRRPPGFHAVLDGCRAIPEDPAARTPAADHAADEAAVSFLPEVVQIEFVDKALDGQLHLGALLGGRDAVTDPDEFDPLEANAMVETEQLARISREAGEVLDEDDLERGRRVEGRGEELLVARAMLNAEAGEGGILVGRDDRPLPALGVGRQRRN